MEPILEIETNLLPPEQIPTAPFEFPKAWVRSTISKEDYFFQFPEKCLIELENLNKELQKNSLPALITRPEMYQLENCKAIMKMIKEVLDAMVNLAKAGMTMIVVTHEMGFAKEVADEVIFMDEGMIVEKAATNEFFANPKSDRTKLFLSQIL